MRLREKVALITGGGGGLGSAMGRHFGREGASVVVQDLRLDAAQEVAEAIGAAGGRAIAWGCDVADSSAIEEMFDAVAEQFGDIDVVVANAGVRRVDGDGATPGQVAANPILEMLDMTDEAWQRMIDVHLTGAFTCTRAMLRRRLPQELPSVLVGISSISALGGYGPAHYAAAKGGILGLVRCLALNGGPLGIRANAICPGVIPIPGAETDPAVHEALSLQTPMRKVGEPDDIAHAAVYLASEESKFVTGHVLSPNGGLEMV
ncbi:MAG: SDR family oxidoreductase [Acidimicrobiia bacterium]|nr:SDR family oxidoreductase [Acidimicrobiia bacterium]MYG58498.1 SDR family oxidoreductase [Acidimicrobiia bacterium]MYJ33748.1 SDR family oxidoreductase [Acidimicrobiia bacterium]